MVITYKYYSFRVKHNIHSIYYMYIVIVLNILMLKRITWNAVDTENNKNGFVFINTAAVIIGNDIA